MLNLKVGDFFYEVKEINTAFSRKKIHREIDGVDWFHYSEPPRKYELIKYKILGIVTKELDGEYPDEWELDTNYYIENSETGYKFTTDLENNHSYTEQRRFTDEEDAIAYKNLLEAQAKVFDTKDTVPYDI